MANFSTHLTGAAAGSGLLSTLFLKAEIVSVEEALLLTAAGTVGGILPDIDLKYSYPSQIVFTVIGTLTALLWTFTSNNNLSVLELWLAGLAIFLMIRYPVWIVFHKFTTHRGAIHSIAAAVMFAFLSSAAAHRLFQTSDSLAWLLALFVFTGFIFHLILDEIYSVDFLGYRIKKSFGSALKAVDMDRMPGTCVILFITLVSWFYTPSPTEMARKLMAKETHDALFANLLPDYVVDRLYRNRNR